MPARQFHCEIRNAGDGPLVCIHGILNHGDWSDGARPWESANPIGPGEIKAFQSESSGVMTGAEGYATFSTLSLGPGETAVHADFLKIYWDLPYFKLDPRDVDPNHVVTVETHRFDPDADQGSSEFVNRDQRAVAISPSVFVSSTPVDFAEQIQNAPELFVGGLAAPFLAPFGIGVNVPDHVYCYVNVAGSVAADATPHTVPDPGFSHGHAVPPKPLPLKGSSLEQWAGTWESDHVTAFIGAAGNALEVTVQEQRQTGQHTIRGNGVPIEQVKLHPFAVPEQAVGADPSGTHSSRLTTGVGAAGTVAQHHSDPRIGVEQGTSFVGDYISLREDASIEIYRLMSGNTMVGQALRYRRPSSHIVSIVESFDEFLYRKANIG